MRSLLILLLILVSGNVLAQNADSLKMQSYISHAKKLFFEGGSLDSISFYFNLASEIAVQNEYWRPYVFTHLARFSTNNSFHNFEKAEYFAFKSLELAKQYLPESDAYYNDALNNLGIYYSQKGNYEKAIFYSREDLRLTRKRSPSNYKYTTWAYIRQVLASYYTSRGDHGRALASYEESISILLDSVGINANSIRALGMGNWQAGKPYYLMKKYDEALQQFKQALAFLEKYDPDNLWLKIMINQSMANTLREDNQFREANTVIEEVEKLQEQYQKRYGVYLERDFFSLIRADIHYKLGETELAAENYLQSIAHAKQSFGDFPFHPRIGHSYFKYGEFLLSQNNTEEALERFNQALPNYFTGYALQHTYEAPPVERLANPGPELVDLLRKRTEVILDLSRDENNLDVIWENAELQLNLIDLLREKLFAEGSHYFLSSQALASYEQAIQLALRLAAQKKDDTYKLKAFSIAEKSKAVLLYSSLKESFHTFPDPHLDSLMEREKQLNLDLAFFRNKLFSENKEKDTLQNNWQRKIFALEEELVQIKEKLRIQYPTYSHFAFSPPFNSLAEIRAKLDSHEALIEYFWGDSAVFVFYIDQRDFEIRSIRRNEKLDQNLKSLLAQLHSQKEENLENFVHDAEALFENLLGPELNRFAPEKLKIIPDGPLGHLSFEVLLENSEDSYVNFRELPYIGKELMISYAYSASLLLMDFRSRITNATQTEKSLGFAPSFLHQVNLSFNSQELIAIRNHWEGDFFSGREATSSKFKALAPQYKYLHLSTHGFPQLDNPAFAHLVFATENGEQDSYLYAHELAQLPLQADLAVLSACESGYGEWARGEGIMSLARSFRVAGCKSILNSLWKADGRVSKNLMERFYHTLSDHTSKDQALQKAKFDFLATASPHQLHPRHWANFVLIGDTNVEAFRWSRGLWIIGLLFALVGLAFVRRRWLFAS